MGGGQSLLPGIKFSERFAEMKIAYLIDTIGNNKISEKLQKIKVFGTFDVIGNLYFFTARHISAKNNNQKVYCGEYVMLLCT